MTGKSPKVCPAPVADTAERLYGSLNDKQKQTFIEEMVRLSHERGLDKDVYS